MGGFAAMDRSLDGEAGPTHLVRQRFRPKACAS